MTRRLQRLALAAVLALCAAPAMGQEAYDADTGAFLSGAKCAPGGADCVVGECLVATSTEGATWQTCPGSGAGDIESVGSACTSGACDSITLADGEVLDLSGINASVATEGLLLPQGTAPGPLGLGGLALDTDDDQLMFGVSGGGARLVRGFTSAPTASRCVRLDSNGDLAAAAADCSTATGDIESVGDCTAGACDSFGLADGELLDLSAILPTAGTEGLKLPQNTGPALMPEGGLAWDTDDDWLMIGAGGAAVRIVPGFTTSPTASRCVRVSSGGDLAVSDTDCPLTTDAPTAHASSHQDGGGDEVNVQGLSGLLNDMQRHGIEKNDTLTCTQRRLNLIEGTDITLTVTQDAGNEECDVTITNSGAGTGDITEVGNCVSGSCDTWVMAGPLGIDTTGGSGDPLLRLITTATTVTTGLDNSDTGDPWELNYGAALDDTPELRVTSAGDVTARGALAIGGAFTGATTATVGTGAPASPGAGQFGAHNPTSGAAGYHATNLTTGTTGSDGAFFGVDSSERAVVQDIEGNGVRLEIGSAPVLTLAPTGTDPTANLYQNAQVVGSDDDALTRTDATAKRYIELLAHKTNAEESTTVYNAVWAFGTVPVLQIGGGGGAAASANAFQSVAVYTASNATTLGGTKIAETLNATYWRETAGGSTAPTASHCDDVSERGEKYYYVNGTTCRLYICFGSAGWEIAYENTSC